MTGTKRFSDVFELDRDKIAVDPKRFQGRQTHYSEESVKAIVSQGYDKSASPIVVWLDKKTGLYYVISGHSRFEASRRLFEAGNKQLKTLPVKEFLGTEAQAADYAILESNRKGTQESLLSDINAYKRAISKGYSKQYLLTIFKPESRLHKLQDLSHLNPAGKFITNLSSTAAKSFPYLERNAQWTGILRSKLPQLTDAHETEIFDYLYGSKKGLSITKDQFFNLIDKKVNRIDFEPDKALNLENNVSTSTLTNPINDQIKEVDKTIEALVKERQKSEELIVRAKSEQKTEMIPKFQQRIDEIHKIILRKMEEKNYLQHQAGKIERETIFDLFSQPETFKETEPIEEPEPPLTCPPIDSDGNRRIDPEGLKLLQKCIDNERPTKAMHTDNNGNYTPERLKLHERIVNEIKDDTPCVKHGKPIAILTGGAPGSGKSTFLKKYAPWITGNKIFHIDADEVRAKLPEYKGWNADNTHQETSDIVNKLLDEIGNPCEHDIVYDGTMNTAKKYLPLIEKLKGLGYEVFVIYITVPKELSIKRAMDRYKRTGRYVPLSVINDVYDRGLAGFEEVIKKVDGFIRVNGETQKIIEKGGLPIPKDRKYDFGKADCKECDHTKKVENKVEFEAPVSIDIDWIIKPTRGNKYTIDQRNELSSLMYMQAHRVDNPSKTFAQLYKDAEKVEALLQKHFGDKYDIIFRNGFKGTFGPVQYIFGYNGWVGALSHNFIYEYSYQNKPYNFYLRSMKDTWTYDNFLDYYLPRAKDILDRSYTFLNQLTEVSTVGFPKDAQTFIDEYSKLGYPLGSEDFIATVVDFYYKIDLREVVSSERIQPILKKYDINYVNSYRDLARNVYDRKITIAQYNEIVNEDKKLKNEADEKGNIITYNWLKEVYKALYTAYEIDGYSINKSNFNKIVKNYDGHTEISSRKNYDKSVFVKVWRKNQNGFLGTYVHVNNLVGKTGNEFENTLYTVLFSVLGKALYYYRNNPEKFQGYSFYTEAEPYLNLTVTPAEIYSVLFKGEKQTVEPGLITSKDNILSDNQKVKKVLMAEFPGVKWKVNQGMWASKIEGETMPDNFITWFNNFVPATWTKYPTDSKLPMELRSSIRNNIIDYYRKFNTYVRPKETRKHAEFKEQYKKEVEETKKQIFPNMNERSVIELGQRINATRSLYSQFIDAGSDNKRRLSPTVENLIRWMENPGRFDLIGVDTFKQANPTADYKSAIQKQKLFNLLGIKI
jgi:predicted ABC-type ATPase